MNQYSELYFSPFAINTSEDNDKIWTVLANQNSICVIDKKTFHARILDIFNGESLTKDFLYSNVAKISNYLIFSPGTAKKIAIYDLKRNCITYIPLEKLQHKCKEDQNEIKFWNIISYQSFVYLLGYSYPAIIKIDIKSFETKYITDWVSDIERYIEDEDTCGYFSDGYVISDSFIFLPVGCMNAILELNLKTDQTKLKKIDVPMKGIGGIASIDNEKIWLVGKGSKTNWVVCWNRYTNIVNSIQLSNLDENIFDPFFAPLCTDSKVFFLPLSASYVYELDIKSEQIKRNSTLELLLKNKKNSIQTGWKTVAPRLENNCLTFFTNNCLEWHEYNMSTKKLINRPIDLDKDDLELYMRALYSETQKENMKMAETKIPLNYFVHRISETDKEEIDNNSKGKSIGKKIYGLISIV